MLSVCLLPVVSLAQLVGDPHDREQAKTSSISSVDNRFLFEKIQLAEAEREFEQIVNKYPQYATYINYVAQVHNEMSVWFRYGMNGQFGSHFYQSVLTKMEDLAAAISDIKPDAVRYACLEVLDHRYLFTPMGEKTYSLKDIAEHVAREIENQSEGAAKPQWGNFYEILGGYSK